jgi:hypothetical protein
MRAMTAGERIGPMEIIGGVLVVGVGHEIQGARYRQTLRMIAAISIPRKSTTDSLLHD